MSNNINGSDAHTSSSSRHVSNVITKLTQNDILFGRGAPIINYEGNVRFRALVSTRKKEYNSTGRHQIKDEIARQIVMEVKRRNGRFLRKLESDDEARQLGTTEGEPAWTIAEEDVILEKVKQALRDKEPEKRLAQSESFDNTAIANDLPSTAGINHGMQALPTSENVSWAGGQLPLLQNSVYRQIALSSLLPQSSYLTNQNSIGELPASSVSRRQSESDLDILRRQHQQIQQQSLLSHITATTSLHSNAYLQALLQQSHSISLPSLSTRDDQGVTSNETLLSMLGVDFNRSRDAATNLQIMGANSQNFDEALRTLYSQNRNDVATGGTTQNFSALGLTTTPTLNNSLRTLQQQYNAAITARREQQRQELQRQILLDPNIQATYFAASRIPQQSNDNAIGSQNNDVIITASLPMGQRPNINYVTGLSSVGNRLPPKSGDSKNGEGESEHSNNGDRKRIASGETESSEASSTTLEATTKKPRVVKNKK